MSSTVGMKENPREGQGRPTIAAMGMASRFLRATQLVAVDHHEVFTFFQDPRNLSAITPPWLDFRIVGGSGEGSVCEMAEFDYTIRWFGFRIPWRSRITEYIPGEAFTDRQLRGPYRFWLHRHLFLRHREGTLVVDEVDYALPLAALPLGGVIGRNLLEIFTFRSRRIAEWALGRC